MTPSVSPSPYEQFLPLPTAHFEMFLKRFFSDPHPFSYQPTSTIFHSEIPKLGQNFIRTSRTGWNFVAVQSQFSSSAGFLGIGNPLP